MSSKPIIFAWYDSQVIASHLIQELGAIQGDYQLHSFPDGESLPVIKTDVEGAEVIIIATLHQPDTKFLPLILLAETMRQCGALRVGLVCPYLSYMRQDIAFVKGESVTSRIFADYISKAFDWLVTVDPHLHRYHDLAEIYSISTTNVQASPAIMQWIQTHVTNPILIGPDAESEQWVAALSVLANIPYQVLLKQRYGDAEVEVSLPDVLKLKDYTPVLVDDIISTAATMIETVKHIHNLGLKAPVCIGTHAVFAKDAYQRLLDTKVAGVYSCNTIEHPSNRIDISGLIANAIKAQYLSQYFAV